VEIEQIAGGAVGIGQARLQLAEQDSTKISTVANSRFEKLTSNRAGRRPKWPNQIKDEGHQAHRDHEVHHDRMERVHPGEVVLVQRWCNGTEDGGESPAITARMAASAGAGQACDGLLQPDG
jgi:hypothetical protein